MEIDGSVAQFEIIWEKSLSALASLSHISNHSTLPPQNGKDLFKDMKDHKVCQIVLFDLSNLS